MCRVTVSPGYRPPLDPYDTQQAIACIKEAFPGALAPALGLTRVSAPLFVAAGTGLNDDLDGCQHPVAFEIPDAGLRAEVVHSLAKWKRAALMRWGFPPGRGVYADMNAIRREERLDALHSAYVDQWDWEQVITREERTLEYLKQTARTVVEAVCAAGEQVRQLYPALKPRPCREPAFVTAQELEDRWPGLSPACREERFVRTHGTACVLQIGGRLRSGRRHGSRAPDYDDWSLNCDILFWHEPLSCAMELSSMGIRVDGAVLKRQLADAGCEERSTLPFHRMLLAGELPLTIGGGVGQSRLCMLLLGCAHIGEVQSALWDAETLRVCRDAGIPLL